MKNLYQSGDLISSKYKVIDILGQGGTATTYKVEDIENNNNVAIKVLSLRQTTDWKIVELFEREAKALANLKHPNIPKYIDYFHLESDRDKRFFLVQQLIPGNSLSTLVEQGWYFSESEVKYIAKKILNILDYLHSLNPTVIHRDIKPQNIIKTDKDEIYLVDFGAVQDVYRNTITRSGTFVGTIDYMPPEQLRGQVNYSSDLYSLGCTLLYLLTRRSPLELPLKKMKLDFRSQVSISLSFARWLDIIIEPIMEERFISTKEALKQLQQLDIPQTKKQARDRELLKAHRVEIEQTGNKLIIDIKRPQKQLIFGLLTIFCFVFILIKDNISNIVNFIVIFGNWLIRFFPTSLVISSVTLFLCLFILDSIFPDRQYLEIDRDRFCLKISSWFYRKKIIGQTKDIKRVEVTKSEIKKHYSNSSKCVLWEGIKPHVFARELKAREQKLLVLEIVDFLENLNFKFSK